MTGSGSGSGSSNGSTNTACAACKYQRRKCSSDCPLSPYFPPDQPKRFANVHKLFGVSNILRILKHVDPSKREDTVKSIAYEADTREKDPVHGCLGVITVLQNQVAKLKEELSIAREQLFLMEQSHTLGQQQLNNTTFHHNQHPALVPSLEDEESQFLRHQIGFDTKLNILPLDYRYGTDHQDQPGSMMSQMKAEQAEQLRRAGGYFAMDAAYDESPVSHHQMHMQAALEPDYSHAIRSSPTCSLGGGGGFGAIATVGSNMKRANYLLASTGQCHVTDVDLRRAGVYLSLTNQHS